jgi:uncharacterized circularly permuted ATP-grasp superfamily protein
MMSAAGESVDEMVDGTRHIRPHWRAVLGGLSMLSDSLASRQRRLDQAFEDEGVRSVLPQATGMGAQADNDADGIWRCDPIPLPIAAAEFAELEAGLAQRAALMAALLDDLYGRQEVLARGLLPPALVFNNPAFLRACHTTAPAFHSRLNFYAADLIRGPDGRWRVLSDRTSGAAMPARTGGFCRVSCRKCSARCRSVRCGPSSTSGRMP